MSSLKRIWSKSITYLHLSESISMFSMIYFWKLFFCWYSEMTMKMLHSRKIINTECISHKLYHLTLITWMQWTEWTLNSIRMNCSEMSINTNWIRVSTIHLPKRPTDEKLDEISNFFLLCFWYENIKNWQKRMRPTFYGYNNHKI